MGTRTPNSVADYLGSLRVSLDRQRNVNGNSRNNTKTTLQRGYFYLRSIRR
jgi:hypothetical protein